MTLSSVSIKIVFFTRFYFSSPKERKECVIMFEKAHSVRWLSKSSRPFLPRTLFLLTLAKTVCNLLIWVSKVSTAITTAKVICSIARCFRHPPASNIKHCKLKEASFVKQIIRMSSSDEKSLEDMITGLSLEGRFIVDIGANLTNKVYDDDLDTVLQRAKDSGKM